MSDRKRATPTARHNSERPRATHQATVAQRDWQIRHTRRSGSHIGTGTGPTPATPAPGLGDRQHRRPHHVSPMAARTRYVRAICEPTHAYLHTRKHTRAPRTYTCVRACTHTHARIHTNACTRTHARALKTRMRVRTAFTCRRALQLFHEGERNIAVIGGSKGAAGDRQVQDRTVQHRTV